MTKPHFRRNTVLLVVIATITALVVRSLIRIELRRHGVDDAVAADLSYLVVPLLVLLLTFPIWNDARTYVVQLYRRTDISLRVVACAVATGILMRTAWWAATVARVSLGWFTESAPGATIGPVFSWQCPPAPLLALGILVMAALVPVVEEIVHRGYIFKASLRWGVPAAILVSSVVFTLLHKTNSWPTVFVAGLVFALQFHLTKSLWASTISHATYNLLIQFDWRCLRGKWLVAEQELPRIEIGLASLLALTVSLIGVTMLVRRTPGANARPGR